MVADPKAEFFVFVDVETTNLSPQDGALLEVGFRVINLELNQIAGISRVVGYDSRRLSEIQESTPEFVRNMHSANGLWNECLTAPSMKEVTDELVEFVIDWGIDGEVLCGSSLKLDRDFLEAYMPFLHKMFHYRSINNSSTKELCKRLNPALYAKLPEFETDHRVDTCLDGTIEEFKFYAESFLFQGE